MRKGVKTLIRDIIDNRVSKTYVKEYQRLLKVNNIKNVEVKGEQEWIDKWSILGRANPIYYRLFSKYIGADINIVPEDICHNIIEPILNPLQLVPYYSDKNVFDDLFEDGIMPRTILRKINGFFHDSKYNFIKIDNNKLYQILNDNGIDRVIVKPSTACSGKRIMLFNLKEGEWLDHMGERSLNIELLNSIYPNGFVMQECLKQHPYMAQFNQSSVNTIRISTYKSVVDNRSHITGAFLRIGAAGSIVDNAHAGGGIVGIMKNGELCHNTIDQHGKTSTIFNNIDLTNSYQIPNWDQVIEFSKKISESILHHRLLALDVMIDENGNPRLIEFNCDGYGVWAFQFSTGAAFGEHTDEIITYCKENIHKAKRVINL